MTTMAERMTDGLLRSLDDSPLKSEAMRARQAEAVLLAVLGDDAAGRPFAELLRVTAATHLSNGGPLADCLLAKADEIDAALSRARQA